MDPSRARRRLQLIALAAALIPALPSAIAAHDIPATVMVRAFVRPDGSRLRLIVRVPLESMRDVTWPLRGPGFLDIAKADSLMRDAARQWIASYVELYEGDTRLSGAELVAARVSLPSDQSFGSYETALAHFTEARLAPTVDLAWQQAMLDVEFEYAITSDQSMFSIRPALAHLGIRTTTVLRFLPPGGAERAFEYIGDPGLVRLDPRWHQAAWRFVQLGFGHILDGVDHLLFVFCLVVPFRKLKPLVVIVTSFTVAHSITLIASASGLAPSALWFPPLIEMLIALSIVYMAVENIVGPKLERRWLIAFGFGLVHGFGFSFMLRDSLQFAGSHLLTSLLSFNLGVEFGQVFVLLLAIPALNALFKYAVAERMGTIILSALVAHTAWHWMTDRSSALRQYQFQWPAFDRLLLMGVMRGLMLLLIVVGFAWMLYAVYRRISPGLKPGTDPTS
ncbi:MAG: HupE/UreJ family protein [Gemmatimonadetes bacterium]|nr:HupE/UreJ family protein [Gemmatimonadota bacterium]